MEDLTKKLNITSKEEWYRLSSSFVKSHGGYSLLKKYNGSASKLITTVFPQYHIILIINTIRMKTSKRMAHSIVLRFDIAYCKIYKWDISKFVVHKYSGKSVSPASVPRRHWDNISNHRKFMDKLAKKLNIKTQDDWYKVTWTTLVKNGASSVLQKYNGSPRKLLTSVFPEYQKMNHVISSQ